MIRDTNNPTNIDRRRRRPRSLTPAQEQRVADKLDGWTCEGQLSIPIPGAGEGEPPCPTTESAGP